MTHSLTTVTCYDMMDENSVHESMRAAADWQLQQVIEWLIENLGWVEPDGSNRYTTHLGFINEEKLIYDLKKAMRSQQQEDN